MKGRGAALLRAVGALVFTLALVVGVPALLVVTVGNPFPSSVPTIDEIRILLTQNGQGFSNFLTGTLAVLIWFMWAQLMVALVVEIVATVRRSETRRLPTAPGVQALAARLVASITLSTALATAPILAPAVGALTFDPIDPAVSIVLADADEPGAWAPPAEARSDGPRTDARSRPGDERRVDPRTVVVVSEHTELWDLAEAAYGDGIAWNTIADANTGALDAQGTPLTADTEAVPPGTSLVVPDAADVDLTAFGEVRATPAAFGADESVTVATAGGAQATAAELTDLHTVESGDSLWSLAERQVASELGTDPTDAEVAEYWVDVVDANEERVASGDVDLIYPGERVLLPGSAANGSEPEAAPAAEPTEVEPAGQTAPAASTEFEAPSGPVVYGTAGDGSEVRAAATESTAAQSDLAPAEATDAESADEREISLPAIAMATFGSGLLAAGILGAVRRRRELQRRQRPSGAVPRRPTTEAAAFEAALIHSADRVREGDHGARWRVLPADAVATMRAAGPVELHAAANGRLSAVPLGLARRASGDAPDSAAATEGVSPITLTPDTTPADVAARVGHEAVPLKPAATEPGLAVVPTTVVIGTSAETGEAVLLDLESSGTVALIGDPGDLRRFVRTAVLDLAVSERADDLCVISVGIAHEMADLERVRVADSFGDALAKAVRCGHGTTDSSTPVVVLSADAPDRDDTIDALRDLGACIVAPGLDAPARITLSGDRAHIWPAGTAVVLAALANDELAAAAELIDSSAVEAVEVVDAAEPVSERIEVLPSDLCPIEPGPVEVKVLGPVEIAGADKFSSLKAVDVVCYLAFHRNGVDADQIKSWVWPAFEPPTDKAFANVLSRARTGLGTTSEGEPFLSRAGADKTYRLSDAVTTDFDRFRALVDAADEAPDDAATVACLRQALELIRGVPFGGGAASSFAWADNHVRAQVEYTIDEAVHRCADLALGLGDLATARWAALKGLELVPGCEQCFRRRFLVAGAGQNRTELRRAMADLERSAAAELGEPEAVDNISAELLDLYHELDRALVSGAV